MGHQARSDTTTEGDRKEDRWLEQRSNIIMRPMLRRRTRGVQPYRIDSAAGARIRQGPWITQESAREILGLLMTVLIMLGGALVYWALQPAGLAFSHFIARLAGR
jgi:hypothetical protein